MFKDYDYQFKLVLIGDAGVGKSSVLLRYTDDNYEENYMATLGVDFRFKNVYIKKKMIKLQIWDTAGQERFRTVTNTYFRNSQAILAVYDMTNKESFLNIRDYWINEIKDHSGSKCQLFLIGNKYDLKQEVDVDFNEVEQFANEYKIKHFEISAKTNEQVQKSFDIIAADLMESSVIKQQQLKLDDNHLKKSNNCKEC